MLIENTGGPPKALWSNKKPYILKTSTTMGKFLSCILTLFLQYKCEITVALKIKENLKKMVDNSIS